MIPDWEFRKFPCVNTAVSWWLLEQQDSTEGSASKIVSPWVVYFVSSENLMLTLTMTSGKEKFPSPENKMLEITVLVMEFNDEKSEQKISLSSVDLLQDREGFTWKGHDRLIPKSGLVSFAPGFQPSFLVQCIPPAAVTAVTLHTEWQLVAFGTSHGFGVFDYYRQQAVLARFVPKILVQIEFFLLSKLKM
eukprot:g39433.t1